jgi:hypothetical protein
LKQLIVQLIAATALAGASHAQIIDPEGPLQRSDARMHVVEFDITLWQMPDDGPDHPFTMKLIVDGPWSMIDPDTLVMTMHAGNNLIMRKTTADFGKPDANGLLTLTTPMPKDPLWPVFLRIHAEAMTFSSSFDQALTARIPWPAAWPAAVQSSLQPEPLIESDALNIQAAVKATLGPTPRTWGPPLAVAKRLVQAACAEFNVDGQHLLHGPKKTIRGIHVRGATFALGAGGGSRADLVCLCVAVLRAAGIPARPVISVATKTGSRDDELSVRAEFFLPEAGWIPIDPGLLRRRGVASRTLADVWRGFGDLPKLDDEVPLCWSFLPDDVEKAYEAWSCWTWTRLSPDAEFPLLVGTGKIRIGDKTVITGQANLHSQLLVRRWSKSRPQRVPKSPWRNRP